MVLQQKFALKDGALVSIQEVEKGLACGCYCPCCNSPLVARKGQIREHHFAHHNSENCVGALESSLHYLAKEILAKEKHMVLPPVPHLTGFVELTDAIDVQFDEVFLEKSEGSFKPDVKCIVRGRPILIEIAVTHFIDDEKLNKIEQRGIPTIQIDLSWLSENYTYEDIREVILNDDISKEWIYNPKIASLSKKYDMMQEQKKLEEEERKKRLEEQTWLNKHTARVREYDAKRLGHQIVHPHIRGISCWKVIFEKASYLKSNEIIEKIRQGQYWNGLIYGRGYGSRRIFLNGTYYELLASANNEENAEFPLELGKKIFGQLSHLSEESTKNIKQCEQCKHFAGHINENEGTFACSYKPHIKK